MKENILYKEVQFLYLIFLFILSPLPVFILGFFVSTGLQATTFFYIILINVLFSAVIGLLFYKLEISVTASNIILKFGVGAFKKSISRTDIKKISKVNIPWYHGIGVRIINANTTQYNAKLGVAVKIELNNKNYIISTNNYHALSTALEQSIRV